MRKIFTLSLAVAGAMAFTATAAQPQISFRPGDKFFEIPAQKGNLELNTSAKHVAKAPQKLGVAISMLKDGALAEGSYTFTAATRQRVQQGTQYVTVYICNNINASITKVEGEANTYSIDLDLSAYAPEGTETMPIMGTYDPATRKLSIPSKQYLWEATDAQYGNIKFEFLNVGLEAEGNDLYYDFNDTSFELVYEGGHSFVTPEYEIDYQTTMGEDHIGAFAIGALVKDASGEGYATYGMNEDTQMGASNGLGIEYLSWYWYMSNNQMVPVPTYFFPQVMPQGSCEFEVRNLFGLGYWDNPVTLTMDKTTKTLTAHTQKMMDMPVGDGQGGSEIVDFYLNADGESTFDVVFNYQTISQNGVSMTAIIADAAEIYVSDANLQLDFAIASAIDSTDPNKYVQMYVYYDIEAINDAMDGIDEIAGDDSNAPVEYFNIQGMKVNGENLSNGVYVRRQGNNVQKVLVK